MERIDNPRIPYLGRINGNFTTGKTITIEGMIILPENSIVINLQTGTNTSYKYDIALRLSVRLFEGKIGRNSMIDGLLGTEENSGQYPFAGNKFKITVKNEYEKFVVTVNDHSFSYRHRLPNHRVNHISIDGDVKVYVIEYERYMSQGDNFRPMYDEPPPPYTPYPQRTRVKTEEPSVLDNVLPLAVGTGLGAVGTALFANLAGRSSKSNGTHGSTCRCVKCTAARNPPRQEQQQASSGWGAFGAGLATLATIGAAAGLVYSLTKKSNDDSDDD